MKPRQIPALLAFVGAAFVAGAIGARATFSSVRTWYPTLHKPAWTPPDWLFGPVWTVLYIAMGVAAWRVWRRTSGEARRPVIGLYATQLVANALWSVLFFGLHRPDYALADIAALWLLLVVIGGRFAKADVPAALLWTPYVIWVSFAAALNAAIWRLNP